MSTHDEITALLDDFAGGELGEAERRRVQRHLDGCAACREEVDALRALLDEARFLPREVAPPRDLWASIAPRLEPRAAEPAVIPLASRRRWQPPRWMLAAAAAVVLVVSTSLITARVVRQGQAPTLAPVAAAAPEAAPTAFVAFQPAEAEYQRAIGALTAVLAEKRGELAPETVEVLETNLRIIDEAIRQSREALAKDPNSAALAEMLSTVYETKIETLQRAVQL